MKKKYTFFAICSLFVLVSCSKTVENCKISPDYDKIGESVLENRENVSESEWKSAEMSCSF